MKLGKFIAGAVAALAVGAAGTEASAAILYQSIADLTEPAYSNGFCSQCQSSGESIGQAFSLASASTATGLSFDVSSIYVWPTSVTVGIYRGGSVTVGANVYNHIFSSFASDSPTANGTDVVSVDFAGGISLAAGDYLLFLTNPVSLAIPGYVNSGEGHGVVIQHSTTSLAGDGYQYIAAGVYDVGVVLTGTSGAPEPSAWALMLLGFGGMGAALRRRTRTAVA